LYTPSSNILVSEVEALPLFFGFAVLPSGCFSIEGLVFFVVGDVPLEFSYGCVNGFRVAVSHEVGEGVGFLYCTEPAFRGIELEEVRCGIAVSGATVLQVFIEAFCSVTFCCRHFVLLSSCC